MTEAVKEDQVALRFYANDTHDPRHTDIINAFGTFVIAAQDNETAVILMKDQETDKEVYMLAARWVYPADGTERFIPIAKLLDADSKEEYRGRYLFPDLNGGWISEQEHEDNAPVVT